MNRPTRPARTPADPWSRQAIAAFATAEAEHVDESTAEAGGYSPGRDAPLAASIRQVKWLKEAIGKIIAARPRERK
jgi:hypothetical protein